jgi:ubiquinone/menaquinone biosynthesis C-methylase UbiE
MSRPSTLAIVRARKRELLHALRGTVLEIGAGRGRNLPDFDRGITWIGLEPNRRRHAQLVRTAAAHGHRGTVLSAVAEQIPLADASVTAVVSTVVLCSVDDQERVLAEVRRVLRPGGSFVFVEHVAADPGTWSRRLQGTFAPATRRFDAGCDPSRETWRTIQDAGFRDLDLRWFTSRSPIFVYGRYIAGRAIA